jgi:hypothetical protein
MVSSGMLCHVALVRTGVPPKRRFLQEPQGITTQKTQFLKELLLVHFLISKTIKLLLHVVEKMHITINSESFSRTSAHQIPHIRMCEHVYLGLML